MKYIYIPRFTTSDNKAMDREVLAYSNFKDCKEYLSEHLERMCKTCNKDVDNDKRLSINAKMEIYSHYRWLVPGEYSRTEIEELKYKKCVKEFAKAKYTLYMYIDSDQSYRKYEYYAIIDRYKQNI